MNDFINNVSSVSDLLKNFSNKDKLAILCYLGDEEKNVSDIIKCTNLSQSQVSQYLGKMKLQLILESEKKGKEVYYKITDKKTLEIISSLKKIFSKGN
ncbi:MAG: metalloregulator ArsR/SmtB family transcription factor [Candidatus Gracilibacteria bacterium]|nr:metalloregulator ArsR/SmtB family transcription factor [Candidatus Gracilibacteria bacterium]